MAKNTQQKKQRRRGSGLAVRLILVLLLAGIGWQLYDLKSQVAAAEAEKARYETAVETLRQENDALAADIAQGSTQEKMEEMAREELGLVYPGERVFYDTSN